MRPVWLLLILMAGVVLARAQEGAATVSGSDARFVLELSDGSRIIGAPTIRDLKLTTDYASVVIPLSQLSGIKLSGSGSVAAAGFRNGDLLTGRLEVTGIELATLFGKVTIPIGDIRTIESKGAARKSALPDGLVLHYAFDPNDGDRIPDKSGNGNDGQLQGGATYTNEGKSGGGAITFNGDRQLVDAGNPASLQLQDFTIAAWVRRTNLNKATADGTADGTVFGYGQGGYYLGIGADGHLFLSKTGIDNVPGDAEVQDGQFHHVAVTKNGSHVIFYLDGQAFPAPDYNPGFEFATDAGVGARSDNRGNCFLGAIGELEVFNRALTGAEIKGIYESQK